MEYEIYHYGVKGMKCGVRRYQNADGTLTSAGRKKARQEYKADNKMAFELGRDATVSGHATARSMKRTIKLENKLEKRYEKDPEGTSFRTKSLRRKWDASSKTTAQLAEQYMTNKSKAEQHCKSLIDKYGKEAVSSIKYTDVKLPNGKYSPSKFKTMNEKTNNLNDYARAGVQTMASIGFSTVFGLPVTMIFSPRTTGEKAYYTERNMYAENLKAQKKR